MTGAEPAPDSVEQPTPPTAPGLVDRVMQALSPGRPDGEAGAPALAGDDPRRADAGSIAVEEHEDPGLHEDIVAIVSAKLLFDYLRERRQAHFPFAIDLAVMDGERARLFIHAMVAAARADGALDGLERSRIEGTLDFLDAGPDGRAILDDALERPRALHDILEAAADQETASLVYVASLMAVDRRKPVNRHYLRYLATRLGLPRGLVERLGRRYRSAA